jgi:hypothetical protein
MDQLIIYLLRNSNDTLSDDTLVAESSHMQIDQLPDSLCKLKLTRATSMNESRLKEDTNFYLEIRYGATSVTGFEIRTVKDSIRVEDVCLEMFFEGNVSDFWYDQNLINILHGWDNGLYGDWRMLNKVMRKVWLTACFLTRFPCLDILEEKVSFDCSVAQTETDFYCALGEALFGNKGYLGKNLNALDDSLLEMRKKEKRMPEISFKNFSHLEKILNNAKMPDYTNILFEIFKSRGCKVEAER